MTEQRDLSGTLSKNTRKEKPSHADYTGSVMIDGRKYWLNGWVKDGRDGKKFLSLSVGPAEQSGDRTANGTNARANNDFLA
jgi:hypothetical protein